ncbi:MAG: Gfo/Idh/MocA family oxidoreductase [Bacteriovoracaceae bacterium]
MQSKNSVKWKVGIIGAGHWGPNLIRNFDQNNKCQVVAICDQAADRLNLIAQKYENVKTTKVADDILNDPTINVVVIATPTKTHYELTKKALLQNKHVFVEKPLATTTEECKELTALADKQKLQLFVGHIFLYNAGVRAVKKIIDSGDLGKIYYLHVTRTNLGPIRTDVSSLWDLAPHDLSIFKYWFNEMPNKVSAKGGCFLNNSNSLYDAVFATYSFQAI